MGRRSRGTSVADDRVVGAGQTIPRVARRPRSSPRLVDRRPHGNEREGVVATADLPQAFATAGLADDVTLWILQDENPDGSAANTRYNANGVDLNRNLPASDFDPSKTRGTAAVR